MDVAFASMRQRLKVEAAAPVFHNLEATTKTPDRLRYHFITDEKRATLRARMRTWRGVPIKRVWLHAVDEVSPSTRLLFKKLSSQATGPGPVYLWKPILHLVLPLWVERVIVLDLDVFFFSDIALLWQQFRLFAPTELVGLVE